MNTSSEVITRFVEQENRAYSAGRNGSKVFRKHSTWIDEIVKEKIPTDISIEKKFDFYFHVLRKGILPIIDNNEDFKLLKDAYVKMIPNIDDDNIHLYRYNGIFLFGVKADADLEHFNKAKHILYGTFGYTKSGLKELSIYFNDTQIISRIKDVFNEIMFNPEERDPWEYTFSKEPLETILIVSNTLLTLDIQNEIFNEKSREKYDQKQKIEKKMESTVMADNLYGYINNSLSPKPDTPKSYHRGMSDKTCKIEAGMGVDKWQLGMSSLELIATLENEYTQEKLKHKTVNFVGLSDYIKSDAFTFWFDQKDKLTYISIDSKNPYNYHGIEIGSRIGDLSTKFQSLHLNFEYFSLEIAGIDGISFNFEDDDIFDLEPANYALDENAKITNISVFKEGLCKEEGWYE